MVAGIMMARPMPHHAGKGVEQSSQTVLAPITLVHITTSLGKKRLELLICIAFFFTAAEASLLEKRLIMLVVLNLRMRSKGDDLTFFQHGYLIGT